MTTEFCRFRDVAVPLLGLSTRHPSIHVMRATRLVDSSFRALHFPDAAGTRLCLRKLANLQCFPTNSHVMHKVNTTKMTEITWSSPKGKFSGAGKEISEALGRKPESTDLNERHPFDVEILRIPPGKAPYSYHSHSAQWEFYHVAIKGKRQPRLQASGHARAIQLFLPSSKHGRSRPLPLLASRATIGESGRNCSA